MFFELFTTNRFINSKKRSFVSINIQISIIGIAFGVAALIVVLSVIGGFQATYRDKVLGINSHIIVMKYGISFQEYEKVMKQVEKVEGVLYAAPFFLNEMMISAGQESTGVLIKGVEPVHNSKVSMIDNYMKQGVFKDLVLLEPKTREKARIQGIIIGEELLKKLKIKMGDLVSITSPLSSLNPNNPVISKNAPKSKQFRLVGVFNCGFYEYDSRLVFVHLSEAQTFLDKDYKVSGIEVKIKNIEEAEKVALSIHNQLGGNPYRTLDWKEINHNLFSSLRLQKVVLAICIGAITLVAIFNILSSLLIITIDKMRQIGILRSIGAKGTSIVKIFVFQGTLIGILGIVFGLILGFLICLLLNGFQLDPQVYLIKAIPIIINPSEIIGLILGTFLISIGATLYPAYRAAKLSPVQCIRTVHL